MGYFASEEACNFRHCLLPTIAFPSLQS